MAKKQGFNPASATGSAPARAVKPATPRTRTAKHSKAIAAESPIETVAMLAPAAAVVTDSPAVEENPLEIISRLAYGYWEARGSQGGNALEDWVRAEEEYRRRIAG